MDLTCLGKVRNRLAYVGVELEGGWIKLPKDANLIGDGSVFVNGYPKGFDPYNMKTGEVTSPVMEPASMAKWIRLFHPHFVDSTCGLHVHMSFRSVYHYELLMNKDYQDTLIKYLTDWGGSAGIPDNHCFWGRLLGNSIYAANKFWPDQQVVATKKIYGRDVPGCRYTILNYCWHQHNTIECRVLPMFENPEVSAKAARMVVDITNASLVILKRRKERVVEEVAFAHHPEVVEEVDQERL